MSTLIESEPNLTYTENGCLAYDCTQSAVLNFFSSAGSMRSYSADVKQAVFFDALKEDKILALKALLYLYDIRKGQGERQLFFDIASNLIKSSIIDCDTKIKLLNSIPTFGRWDMLVRLLAAIDKKDKDASTTTNYIFNLIKFGLDNKNDLCKKWMPRQGKEANRIRGYLKLKPKEWRKLLTTGHTTEQDMSSNNWDEIEYEHVPSKCMKIHHDAFRKHTPEKYDAYETALSKGETKVNASVVYPYEIICDATDKYVSNTLDATMLAMWKALPDYMEGKKINILPMVDVSGSMTQPIFCRSKVSCMSVAVSLGLYTSERNTGTFKDELITFTDIPKFIHLDKNDDLNARIEKVLAHEGFNTDLEMAFNRLLTRAIEHHIPKEEMPSMILVLSDMQFDDTSIKGQTMGESIEKQFKDAGYDMPILVYWNLNAYLNNGYPTTKTEKGKILISGFSPSVLKPIMQMDFNNITPYAVMLKVLNNPRYNVF